MIALFAYYVFLLYMIISDLSYDTSILVRVVLFNGPGGPRPRAPNPQGTPKQPMHYFSSRKLSVTNCSV